MNESNAPNGNGKSVRALDAAPPAATPPAAASPAPPAAERPRATGGTITPICPLDLRALEPVPMATAADVDAAVARARAAQEAWRGRSLDERVACAKRAARTMLRRRAEIIALVRDEMGKLECDALFNEALGPLDAVAGWARVLEKSATRQNVRLNPINFPGKRAYVDLVPRGVVGIIAPWNYPVAGLYRSVLPALLTGNGVVLKPSEYTPRSSAWLAECLATELPEGLLQVVQGDGAVGAALVDAGIDACVFTGSPRVGRGVRVQCAERGIPCSVEMGGKDAAIVLADCDLERTVAGITQWALGNVGQACGAIEVAYVDHRIADAFVDALRLAWVKLRVGPGAFAGVDISPLANQRQFDVVCAHVADARARGAAVVCGGEPVGVGLWYRPTVLDRCDDTMAVVRDETFGPVLAVVRVEGAAEAIRRVNRSRYGLGASIWTTDLERAQRLGERLEVGVVNVNNHAMTGAIPDLPWSGTRETGFGVANSAHSLATFTRPRTTLVDQSSAPEMYWLPYDKSLWDTGDILSDLQLTRLERAWRIPFLMRERVRTVREFFKRLR